MTRAIQSACVPIVSCEPFRALGGLELLSFGLSSPRKANTVAPWRQVLSLLASAMLVAVVVLNTFMGGKGTQEEMQLEVATVTLCHLSKDIPSPAGHQGPL